MLYGIYASIKVTYGVGLRRHLAAGFLPVLGYSQCSHHGEHCALRFLGFRGIFARFGTDSVFRIPICIVTRAAAQQSMRKTVTVASTGGGIRFN